MKIRRQKTEGDISAIAARPVRLESRDRLTHKYKTKEESL